uniref:Uncharacterized protein n=1 Tax=Oryza nivara TaxID=4536 RepID=A0A0E0G3S6_ORYNI
MLHHRQTFAGMWNHCTGAPRRPAFMHPPPYRTVPASSTANNASLCHAGLLHRRPRLTVPSRPLAVGRTSSRQAGLHRRRLRHFAPCQPLLPPATPQSTVPASNPSSSRCHAGQVRSSITPPRLAARGRPCLLSQSSSPVTSRRRCVRTHTHTSPSPPPYSFLASTCYRQQPSARHRQPPTSPAVRRRLHNCGRHKSAAVCRYQRHQPLSPTAITAAASSPSATVLAAARLCQCPLRRR